MSPCSALVGSTLDTVTSVTRVKKRQARAAALRREQLLAHSARVLGPAESLGASKSCWCAMLTNPGPTPGRSTWSRSCPCSSGGTTRNSASRWKLTSVSVSPRRDAWWVSCGIAVHGWACGCTSPRTTSRSLGAWGTSGFRFPFSHMRGYRRSTSFLAGAARATATGCSRQVLAMLSAEGVSTVVVGAGEDDWPLSWYRRRGFRDTGRMSLDRCL